MRSLSVVHHVPCVRHSWVDADRVGKVSYQKMYQKQALLCSRRVPEEYVGHEDPCTQGLSNNIGTLLGLGEESESGLDCHYESIQPRGPVEDTHISKMATIERFSIAL
jgi:hypothetical protein